MPPASTKPSVSPGTPDPRSILSRQELAPPQARRAAAAQQPQAAPQASRYTIIVTDQVDEYERHEDIAAFATTAAAAPVGDDFQGTARMAAKLSISAAQVEVFADLQDLLASLPAESDMVSHDPPITTDAESDRVAEEQRNVQVRAFLYAASRENDNDFHLILGRDPSLTPSMFMTMEVSGLPQSDADSFATLQAAREAYKTEFGSQLPGFTYHFIDPPMPVEIGGSLFFDINHANGGRPGPRSAKPATIWEVHPVTTITFEPDQGSNPDSNQG